MTSDDGNNVSLKEYIQDVISSESALRKVQLESTERALLLAKEEIDRRLHGMNEMREQINRERGSFVTRDLHDRMERVLTDKISSVQKDATDKISSVQKDATDKISGVQKMVLIGVIIFLVQLVFAIIAYVKK